MKVPQKGPCRRTSLTGTITNINLFRKDESHFTDDFSRLLLVLPPALFRATHSAAQRCWTGFVTDFTFPT